MLELSEVILVLKDPSGYPFGHEGSGWRYQSREVYLISKIISSTVTFFGLSISFWLNKSKKLFLRLALCLIIFLIILELRLSIS